jgi:predicted RNA-binding Zn ribbon-like protein
MAELLDTEHPVLDFINTAYGTGERALDELSSFDELCQWLRQTGLIDVRVANRWARLGIKDQERLLAEARSMRTSLRGLFDKLASAKRVTNGDLSFINESIGDVRIQSAIDFEDGRFAQRIAPIVQGPGDIAAALGWSAAELLDSNQLIRRCANHEGCTLLFIDATKNHRRVWCSVKTCGNRAKVAAFRNRRREADSV